MGVTFCLREERLYDVTFKIWTPFECSQDEDNFVSCVICRALDCMSQEYMAWHFNQAAKRRADLGHVCIYAPDDEISRKAVAGLSVKIRQASKKGGVADV